jgi:hypothetical protein
MTAGTDVSGPALEFELPDLMTSSTLTTFEFSPATKHRAAAVVAAGPEEIFGHLMRDQESETHLLVARQVIHGYFSGIKSPDDGEADADELAAHVRGVRDRIGRQVESLARFGPDIHGSLLRQRAPISLSGGCWLDVVSQPATQPSVIVNHLLRQHVRLKGAGNVHRSAYHLRRRVLEDHDVFLPDMTAKGFLRAAQARPLTALHACLPIALSRLPVSFLPEVVGVHYAYHAIGVDELLTGTEPMLAESAVRGVLAEYLTLSRQSAEGATERRRLRAAVRLVERLETEHVAMLTELAAWTSGLSLDARVAAIVARHAPFAGRQHGEVRVGGRRLTDTFADPHLDLGEFLRRLRDSPHLRPRPDGGCRFLDALRFGGPMFGIFDQREAATLRAWVSAVHAGSPPEMVIPVNRVGDERARAWSAALTEPGPDDVVFAEPAAYDERELFYRLVNIEHFPNTLAQARERAERALAAGEMLFTHGAGGTVSDASWFDYSPDALAARVEDIYWGKLVGPYRPLETVPNRDEVIFGQALLAMSALVDGAWAGRTGNIGRYQRRSDGLIFSVYADEMGLGELRKNHVALIRQVLANLAIALPHIRDAAFRDQAELPDSTYDYALHQLCISLFPDSLYNEILGFNLGIELSGLGRQRMHEIQKLRAHGLDPSYEEIHLSIDNLSAGHARQATDAIVAYLDDVSSSCGGETVQREWRRIWRGYAAFASFAEPDLVKRLTAPDARPDGHDEADLVI